MRKILILAILFTGIANGQVFTGKGDAKFQIGAHFQNKGNGIIATFDKGINQNMSFGVTSSYILGIEEVLGEKPNFDDRFDIRARFSANIADIFNIEDKFYIYPGLNVGIKNFGAHLGGRYYFTDAFGVYSEVQFPIAYYDNNPDNFFEKYNNQFNFSIGASFNL